MEAARLKTGDNLPWWHLWTDTRTKGRKYQKDTKFDFISHNHKFTDLTRDIHYMDTCPIQPFLRHRIYGCNIANTTSPKAKIIWPRQGQNKGQSTTMHLLYITTVYSPRPGTRFHKQNTLCFNNKYTRFSITVKLSKHNEATKQQRHQPKTSTPIQRTKWRYRYMTTTST